MCHTSKTESCLRCPSSSDAQGGPGRQRGKGSEAHFASGEAWLRTSVLWPRSQHRSSQAHRKGQSLIQESHGALTWLGGVHLPIPLTQHRAEPEMYGAPTRHPTLKSKFFTSQFPAKPEVYRATKCAAAPRKEPRSYFKLRSAASQSVTV